MNTQVCRICDEDKHISEFHFRADRDKHRTECKSCRSKSEAARRYNITVGEIDSFLLAQDSSCAICKTHVSEIPHKAFTTNPLVVDHNHLTGVVRGLLCPNCNIGLGQFRDDPALLRRAAQYLEF